MIWCGLRPDFSHGFSFLSSLFLFLWLPLSKRNSPSRLSQSAPCVASWLLNVLPIEIVHHIWPHSLRTRIFSSWLVLIQSLENFLDLNSCCFLLCQSLFWLADCLSIDVSLRWRDRHLVVVIFCLEFSTFKKGYETLFTYFKTRTAKISVTLDHHPSTFPTFLIPFTVTDTFLLDHQQGSIWRIIIVNSAGFSLWFWDCSAYSTANLRNNLDVLYFATLVHPYAIYIRLFKHQDIFNSSQLY